MFFAANDDIHGAELWTSDGTAAGTRLFKDINPGDSFSNSDPANFIAFQGKLYFTATSPEGEFALGLWRSDGTEAGTVLVKSLGHPGYGPTFPTLHAGRLWFISLGPVVGFELWSSDGTAQGTAPVDLGSASVQPGFLFSIGSKLLFSGEGIWSTDGTPGGTQKISSTSIGFTSPVAVFQGRLFFADQGSYLWASDGTEAGTGPFGEEIPARYLAVLGDHLVISTEEALWVSDGTEAGTLRIRNGSGPLLRAGNRVFFPAPDRATGVELWAMEDN